MQKPGRHVGEAHVEYQSQMLHDYGPKTILRVCIDPRAERVAEAVAAARATLPPLMLFPAMPRNPVLRPVAKRATGPVSL